MRNKGFSLVEIIIVVSVMGILVSLSLPAYIDFMQKERVQREENALSDIQKAMQVFAQRYGKLPNIQGNTYCETGGNATWNECLATVSNLSASQILLDTWGNDRAYMVYQESGAVLLDANINFFYATIFSRGEDQKAENTNGVAVAGRAYADKNDNQWWMGGSRPEQKILQLFQTLEPKGDDLMVKYTDRSDKMKSYEVTLERIRAITDALSTYAQVKYNEATINGEANADYKIYYPPSQASGGASADYYASYGSGVRSDMTTGLFGGDKRVDNSGNNTIRRNEMINLVRMLGLPDSYCCDAMERVKVGGKWVEPALYYYSNPKAKTSATACSSYRGSIRDYTISNKVPRYMPARVSTQAYGCR